MFPGSLNAKLDYCPSKNHSLPFENLFYDKMYKNLCPLVICVPHVALDTTSQNLGKAYS
jgi:hypothetical protein